jgi:hypothetical protein
MVALRSFLSFGVLVALAACQSVNPPTEPSALEIANDTSATSYAASGSCVNGFVKVCAKEFTSEPFTCECLEETRVLPIWNR